VQLDERITGLELVSSVIKKAVKVVSGAS